MIVYENKGFNLHAVVDILFRNEKTSPTSKHLNIDRSMWDVNRDIWRYLYRKLTAA